MSIRESLTNAIKARFPKAKLRIDPSNNPFLALIGPAQIGEIGVWDDGDEATLTIGNLTHSHINPYDSALSEAEREAFITEEVIEFLDDLFQDKVLLWVANNGGSGGLVRFDAGPPPVRNDAKNFFWSGPL